MRVLCGVDVVADGVRLDVGHARQRDVLAVLLLEVDKVVPVDRLIDRVWAERPPAQPRNALYGYVSRLRRALAALDGVTIERDHGGYVLRADPQTVDIHRFENLLARAKTTADETTALALYDEALTLWRGRPLGELDSPWADSVRDDLERKHEVARLDRNELRLRSGAHAQVLAEPATGGVVGEREAAQRIEALFLDGRPADALREYEEVRSRLADELGADPGPRLRRLHERILAGGGPGGETPAPQQLPAAPLSFTGRTDELAALDRLLAAPGAVVVVSGAGGLGKTWLVVRWATDHASRFADGQLYVDLRGFDPVHEPMPAERAVRGLLGALGIAPTSIPPEPEAQAALYRTLTTGRRLLVVLDNVRDTEHVVPLLPGGSSCSVLITSRHELGGLLTTHGANTLPLRPLDERQARDLLAHKLGAAQLADEPGAAEQIIRQCGGMSLALAIVGARVIAQPERRLAAIAAELRDSRLDALDTGELTASLRAVFDTTYRSLDAASASAFRLLGLAPADDIERVAATAMIGDSRLLRVLCAASLMEETPQGRFRMHDLVKLYASELAVETDDTPIRLAASARLFDHYLCWASTAMEWVSPDEAYLRPPATRSAGPQPRFADGYAARAWLDAERTTMLAMATGAPESLSGHVIQLSATLWRYLYIGAHHNEALTLHATALELTRPGTKEKGFAHQAVGMTLLVLGRYGDAAGHFKEALTIALDQGNELLESIARIGTASVDDLRGESATARNQYELALVTARRSGHALLEGAALFHIGDHFRRNGDHRTANGYLRRSGAIALDLGSAGLGGLVFAALGNTHAGLGQSDDADEHFHRALTFARSCRNTNLEISTLNELAATKSGSEAVELYEESLALARRTGHLYERARAHYGLGTAHRAAGNRARATFHLETALTAYAELCAPEADDVHTLLATLSGSLHDSDK
ncbi:AfsR/SARP family transcriptional regulator [Amycolatopsis coloradensis]|nr:BTAD domain-containing putative transcriptional regulator [Amycolatopsis coloradensis]